ncbi:coagulation factor IX-like isoform X2 [Varroa jacobsoni]|uniref:Vitamin K-dependent protein C n=1 Tax=Varroa destructor TaxID=109461 RepID=A0A7M7JQT4_VARDE|nr:coagulation factor IX-like isoform X2 [Varroa destructor]XP_022690340.1 coagulation factor IX-like isoform X2 [Varroa jacobsoni]
MIVFTTIASVWLFAPPVTGVAAHVADSNVNSINAKVGTTKDPHLERPKHDDIRRLIALYNEDRRPVCPCGLIGHSRTRRVIGGTLADIEAYPYASQDVTIEVGRTNITGPEKPSDPLIRRVVRIERHEHYDQPSYNNDIAVLTLDAPLLFGRTSRPACLPPYGSDVQDGTSGEVVGWGRIAFKGKKSDTLQNVTLPVVNRTECQRPLRHRISTNMLCAGGLEERDACVGDSGGPFIVKYQSAPLLVGVVSFGKKCGLANVYGVYTRVGLYTRFIYEQTKEASCKPGILSMRDYRAVGNEATWISNKVNQWNHS